jgi:hypothetical protein
VNDPGAEHDGKCDREWTGPQQVNDQKRDKHSANRAGETNRNPPYGLVNRGLHADNSAEGSE